MFIQSGFIIIFLSIDYLKEGIFSSEQERKKVIVQKPNEKNIREAWQEHGGPSKPRSLWNQQPHIDSTVLNRYTPMNDSTGKQPNSYSKFILNFIYHSFKCT